MVSLSNHAPQLCHASSEKNHADLSNTSQPKLFSTCPFRRECFRKLSKGGKGSALRPRGEENLCGRGGFASLPPFLARERAEQGKILKNRRSGWSLDRKHSIPHTPRPAFQGPPVFPFFNSQTQLRAWQRERPVMSNATGQHRRIIAVRQPFRRRRIGSFRFSHVHKSVEGLPHKRNNAQICAKWNESIQVDYGIRGAEHLNTGLKRASA